MIENSQSDSKVIQPAPNSKRITLLTKPRLILRGVLIALALVTVYSLVTLDGGNFV